MVKFFRCNHCGNIVEMVHDAGVPMQCCGERMGELTPNTVDAATEKHVPVYTVADGVVHVEVGSVAHPMLEEHLIEFVVVETNAGVYRKSLKAGEAPVADFHIGNETVTAVYEFCNLHGLWKA